MTAEIERGEQAYLARIEWERCQGQRAAEEAITEAERHRLAHLPTESLPDNCDGWFGSNLKRISQKELVWIARFRNRRERERWLGEGA